MNGTAAVMLAAVLVLYATMAVADAAEYPRFVALQDTEQRQRVMRKWVIQSVVAHGLVSLACLAIIGQLSALLAIPEPLGALSVKLEAFTGSTDGDSPLASIGKGLRLVLLPALAIAFLGNAFVRPYLESRTPIVQRADPRNIEPLVARNGKERVWTALLSVNAGVSEEIAFRLLLPLLIWMVSGSITAALVLSTVIFGSVHLYQGPAGIAATTLAGALFMFLYLLSGSIWIVMAMHALGNLGSLTIAPWFADVLSRRNTPRGRGQPD